MANHARDNRGVGDKRSALAGAQPKAYSHADQVGGTRRREADGRWVDRGPQPVEERPKPINKLTLGEFIVSNITYILSAAAVAVIALLLIFGVRAFSGVMAPAPEGEGEYASPYDWSKLDRSTDHYAYVVNGQVKSRLGVDVSEYDHEIDWNAVASDGIDFAIIRLGYRGATEGDLYLDDYYEQNFADAKAAGLDRGVYFFSQAANTQEAVEEADFVLANLNGASLEYPIAFDFEPVNGVGETRAGGLSSEELTAIADAFCDRIEAAGYRTLVYGNGHDLKSYDVDATTGRDIWWAEYDVEAPSHYLNITLWQYTSLGDVAGIGGGADMNIDLSGVVS